MADQIRIGRIYTDRGQIFFLPYDDRYLIFGLEESEEPGAYDANLTLRQIAGDVEAIFEKPLPVDMELYRSRFRQMCRRFDELNRCYSDGEHTAAEMGEDASIIDNLAYLCREIVESCGTINA